MTNEEYIQLHRTDDVRQLALKQMPEGVDAVWCLQQIEGWQLAQNKLPQWAEAEGLWFPPRLSMEQCSSEATALYKRGVIERLMPDASLRHSMVDYTGGYGVDFSYIAPLFGHASYVERLPHLCDIANHNFTQLNLTQAEVVCAETNADSPLLRQEHSLAYIDPARRDTAGRKTVAIADCTPDITELLPIILDHTPVAMIKLSPMLDITQALRSLPHVSEVHVVSVKGECKELLLVCTQREPADTQFHCANLCTDDPIFICPAAEMREAQPSYGAPLTYLYEPNASILKANAQNSLAQSLHLQKLHPMSNLFTSAQKTDSFPGRTFRLIDHCDFNKKNLRRLLAGITQANITIRNFPTSVAELRKRLKLRDGGTTYLFATTLADGTHALLRCEKA